MPTATHPNPTKTNTNGEARAPVEWDGYKHTRVGWIPEEWEITRLKKVLSAKPRYGASSASVEYDPESTYRYIRITDITDEGRLIEQEKVGIEKSEGEKYLLQKDDVLIARTGASVGKSYIHSHEGIEAAYAGYLIRFKLDPEEYDVDLFYHFLHSPIFWGWVSRNARTGAQPNINSGEYQSLTLPKPPLPEQRRIAAVLADWDRALVQTGALLDAKQRRKKALMQQLLLGKKRLPVFGDEAWQTVKIGDLLKRVKRYVEWDDDAQYDLVSVRRGSEGMYHRESIYGREIKVKKLHTLREGDFVISRMQVVHGATAYVTPEFDGGHVSNSYYILRPQDGAAIDTEFFAWLAKMPYMYHLAYLASHGVHIEKMSFKPKFYFKSKIEIPPTVEEQRAIAAVLNTCDEEIETLRAERAALWRQKKGMMQKLLTGRVRVPAGPEPTSPTHA